MSQNTCGGTESRARDGDYNHRGTRKGDRMVSNEILREMAQTALQHWDFDAYTNSQDADECQTGLRFLAEPGDWEQDVIDGHITSAEDWDGLESWARYLGS
jgi:hypothetical protein